MREKKMHNLSRNFMNMQTYANSNSQKTNQTHKRRLKEVMAYIYGKIKQIRLPFFHSSSKFASKNTEINSSW